MSTKFFNSAVAGILAFSISFVLPGSVDAGPRTRNVRRADRNKDGHIGPRETRKARNVRRDRRSEVDTPVEERIDRNDDGKVDRRELHRASHKLSDRNGDGKVTAAEFHHFLRHKRAKVNTPLEKKYDADGNGWLSKSEAIALLKDRLRVINTRGRAKVNTPLEKEFDTNGDGVIDRSEAEAMKDAAKS